MYCPDELMAAFDVERSTSRWMLKTAGAVLAACLVIFAGVKVAAATPACGNILDGLERIEPPEPHKAVCIVSGIRAPCVKYRLEGTVLVALYNPSNPEHLVGVKFFKGSANLCWDGEKSDL